MIQPEQYVGAILGSLITLLCVALSCWVFSIAFKASREHEFYRYKQLCAKDDMVIEMLSSYDPGKACWVITDPDLDDNPIVHASVGFCQLTKYSRRGILNYLSIII